MMKINGILVLLSLSLLLIPALTSSGDGDPTLPYGCEQRASNGLCKACKYKFWNLNGYCQQVSDLCQNWDITTGACTSCYNGYILSSGSCVGGGNGGQVPEGCSQQNANGQCIACYFRYYLNNGTCKAVSDQCKTWDSNTGACLSCYSGWTLSSGTCTVSGQLPAGCSQQNGSGQCTACFFRYYLNNGICIAVSDQCKTWDSNTGACTSCYDGWNLVNGSCTY